MRGLVFRGDREIEIRTFDDPKPGPGEVVLEMKASGICGSDLIFYRASRGKDGFSSMMPARNGRPLIGGHEPCGVVIGHGAGVDRNAVPLGKRVIVHHYIGCQHCDHCLTGWAQMCSSVKAMYGLTADGGHANYLVVPAETLVTLPDSLSFEVGAALACGTGTAWGGLVRMDVSGRDHIVITGQGPVGLSGTALAKGMGAFVIAVDISDERLAAATRAGADVVINASKTDTVEAVMDATKGRGATKALEASGTEEGRLAALACTRAWGSIALVGYSGTVTINVPELISRQHTLIGSWTFSTVGLAECARFVEDREIPIDDLITVRATLDDAESVYREVDRQSGGKAVFVF